MHRHAWAWPVYKVHYKTQITSSTADRSGDWHTSRETVHGCILGKLTPKWLSLAMTYYYSMRCLPPSTTQANYVQNGWNWVALLSAMNIKGTTLLILTIGLQKQDRTVFVPLSKRATKWVGCSGSAQSRSQSQASEEKAHVHHCLNIELLLFTYICKWHWATDSAYLFVHILSKRFLSKRSEGVVCTYVYINRKFFCLVQCRTTF